MNVSLQYAKAHLAYLIAAASRGEIVYVEGPQHTAQIIAYRKSEHVGVNRMLGAGRGEMRVPSDLEWHAMDKELEHLMNDSPLIPSDQQ